MSDSPETRSTEIRSTELYATLSQATKDITAIREWLNGSKDRIDKYIAENVNDFDDIMQEAYSSYEDLSDEKINTLNTLYEKIIYPFNYVGNEEPTTPNENEIWFKTDEVKIFKFVKNPKITFFQEEKPIERKVNDIWFKPTDDNNLQTGKFYLCEKVLKNQAWINPSLPENLEPAFNQEDAPETATLGDIWKKTSTNEYFVYIRTTSGNSWVNPENPSEYTPTYESEEEPSNANIGDIWKKGNEYLIYTRVTNDTVWVLKENLGINAFVWLSEEKESIKLILSLIENLKTELNKKTKLLSENLTWIIGSGGDYEDLQNALNEAGKYISNNNSYIILKIKNGYTIASPTTIKLNVKVIIEGENSKSDELIVDLNNKDWTNFGLFLQSETIIQNIKIKSTSINNSLIYIDCAYVNIINVDLTGNSLSVVAATNANVILNDVSFQNTYNTSELCYDLSCSYSTVVLGANVNFTTDNQEYSIAIRAATAASISSIWWQSGTQISGNYKTGIEVNGGGIILNPSISMNGSYTTKYSQAPEQWTSSGYISTNI